MTVFDYAVLLITGLSVLLGVMRGLVQELLALIGWLAALLAAKSYATQLVPLLPDVIPGEAPRLAAAFIMLFLVTLMVMSLARLAVSGFVKALRLGAFNRALGAAFGLARGLLIAGVIVLLAGLTALPQQEFWKNAMLSAPLEAMVISAKPWLPDAMAKHLNYE